MATARAHRDIRRTQEVPRQRRSPDGPTDLEARSWWHVAKRTFRGFSEHECTDLAAGLTYYAVLALFPALVALVSLLGVFGQGEPTIDALLKIVGQLGPDSAVDSLRPTIERLSTTSGAGFALAIGLAGALWSASGYVGGFGRALNRIYEVSEGRPFWKLRPLQVAVTLVTVLLVAFCLVALVVTGPVAGAVGDAIGLGSTTVTAWEIAKWPVLAAVVVGVVALLYYATPNIEQPSFRWISPGALVAIAVWVLASAGFALYVSQFSSYDKTYGSLAGAIVFLLWLWLTNVALLLGAQLDVEIERGRELQSGEPAETELQLDERDDSGIEKAERKDAEEAEEAREIRLGS